MIPAFRAETALHHVSREARLQRSFTLMPSANLIQSANRWLGTAITTGISALNARSTIGKALSIALLPSEPVDDHEVRTPIDGAGNLCARVQQLADVQPAPGSASPEILEQWQFLAGVDQHGRQLRCIDAMMAELDQSDRAISARIQIGGKPAQDLIRILILLVEQGSKIALGVKHHASLFQLRRSSIGVAAHPGKAALAAATAASSWPFEARGHCVSTSSVAGLRTGIVRSPGTIFRR